MIFFIYVLFIMCWATLSAIETKHDDTDFQIIENTQLSTSNLHTAEPVVNSIQCGETTESLSDKKSVTITNGIDEDMLLYKHWTGTYKPDNFTLSINSTILANGESYTLIASNDPIVICFEYSFLGGMRSGSKTYSYRMNEGSTHALITFSWMEDNYKVLLDNATPIKKEME